MASTLSTILVVLLRTNASRVAVVFYLVGFAGAYAAYRALAPEWLAASFGILVPIVLAGFAGGLPFLSTALSWRFPGSPSGSARDHHLTLDAQPLDAEHGYPHSGPLTRQQAGLRGERRRVTVMFADISDSASLAQAMDPEEVRDLINSCFDRMVPVVTEYGGTVNTFLGDGILALFGAPAAHEDDPDRCLHAALRMQDVLADFSAEQGANLKMHFGIATGFVVAGDVGSSGRHDYGVMGEAVNLAARLEDVSANGEILVGLETYRLSNRRFEFQRVGPLRLKGWNEPVPAFKLLGASIRPAAWRSEVRDERRPLVGRSLELDIAKRSIEGLKSGRGGVLSIVGDAGVGKSRLISELRRLAGDGLIWLQGGDVPAGQHTSYGPFVEIIQAYTGILASDGEDERWRKLEGGINALLPGEGRDLLPYLAALLNVDAPAEHLDRLRYLDGEEMGSQVFRAVRRLFAALAERSPLVIVFEDIHSLDESSILLLEHILPLCCEHPLLIVVTGRARASGFLNRVRQAAEEHCENTYEEILLSPLSPSDTAQLVRGLIRSNELPFGLREVVFRKTEGNPLFVEEVVRTLMDLGALTHEEGAGRWKVTERVEQISIPDTLIGIIAARIDRLSDRAKEVLRLAAVLGRSFQYRVLEGISEPGHDLAEGLWELHVRGLLSKVPSYPESEFSFKHALIQEAAYASILSKHRQDIHRRVAEYLEVTLADRLDDFYGLIAYHYTKAEVWAKAQQYLLKAGNQAGRIAADAEALAHYQQALAAYSRALGDKWNPVERAVLESNMGEALYRRGEHGHGRRHLERALKALGNPYPASRWGIRAALVLEIADQVLHRATARFAGPISPQIDPVSAELNRQYETIKWMDFFLDGERHMLSSLLLLNHAERYGNTVGIVRASSGLGIGLDAIGLRRLGEFYCRRAALLADKVGEPRAIGDAYMLLGIQEEYTRGRAGTREHYRRAAEGYWEAGSIKGWAAATTLMGRSMARSGDFYSSLEVFRHVRQVAEDGAERQALGWGLTFEGEMLERVGDLEEATSYMLRAIELFKEVPDHMSSALSHGLLGRCYMHLGKLSEAQQLLEEARRSVVEHRLRGFMCSPVWLSLAEVELAVAEQNRGVARNSALARARRSADTAIKQGDVDALALAPALRIRGSVDYLEGRTDHAFKWWQRSLLDAEIRQMRHELGLTHLEIGRHTGDRSHIRRAQSLFAEMGARFDLSQASGYLGFERSDGLGTSPLFDRAEEMEGLAAISVVN